MSAQPGSLRLPEPGKTYRVVQWATGRIGQASDVDRRSAK